MSTAKPPMQRRRSTHLTEDEHDALERKLQERPHHHHVTKKNICHKTRGVHSTLAGKKRELERSMTRDNVGHLLESRPDLEELVSAGVIHHHHEKTHPRLHSVKKQLERSMTKDKLGQLLDSRAHHSELNDGIHKACPEKISHKLHGPQQSLKKELAKSNLYHALSFRPSVVELIEKGVYVPNDEDLQHLLDDYEGDEEEDDDYTGDYGDAIGVPDAEYGQDDFDDFEEEPAFIDEYGNPHYHDADGNLYVVAEDGNAYYVEDDEEDDVEPYYIDKYGNPYYLDDAGKPYIVAEDGQAYYVENDDPDDPMHGPADEGTDDYGYGDYMRDEYGYEGSPTHNAEMYEDDEDDYEDEDNLGYEDEAEVEEQRIAPAARSGGEALDRSRAFTLTRLLLKTVSMMSRSGELSEDTKGAIKDLIVDQDDVILSVAESYLETEDLMEMKESLLSLVL